jgi:hypothetical protein
VIFCSVCSKLATSISTWAFRMSLRLSVGAAVVVAGACAISIDSAGSAEVFDASCFDSGAVAALRFARTASLRLTEAASS